MFIFYFSYGCNISAAVAPFGMSKKTHRGFKDVLFQLFKMLKGAVCNIQLISLQEKQTFYLYTSEWCHVNACKSSLPPQPSEQ